MAVTTPMKGGKPGDGKESNNNLEAARCNSRFRSSEQRGESQYLVYQNVVAAFVVQPVTLVYIMAMARFIFNHWWQ